MNIEVGYLYDVEGVTCQVIAKNTETKKVLISQIASSDRYGNKPFWYPIKAIGKQIPHQ